MLIVIIWHKTYITYDFVCFGINLVYTLQRLKHAHVNLVALLVKADTYRCAVVAPFIGDFRKIDGSDVLSCA